MAVDPGVLDQAVSELRTMAREASSAMTALRDATETMSRRDDRALPPIIGWTVETLKEHVEALRTADKEAVAAALAAAEKAVSAALTAADKAVGVSEVAAKEWRSQANEWRGAMDDRDRKSAAALEKYAQRDAVDSMRVEMQRQITELKEARERGGSADETNAKRDSQSAVTRTLVVAAIGLLLTAAIVVLGVINAANG